MWKWLTSRPLCTLEYVSHLCVIFWECITPPQHPKYLLNFSQYVQWDGKLINFYLTNGVVWIFISYDKPERNKMWTWEHLLLCRMYIYLAREIIGLWLSHEWLNSSCSHRRGRNITKKREPGQSEGFHCPQWWKGGP